MFIQVVPAIGGATGYHSAYGPLVKQYMLSGKDFLGLETHSSVDEAHLDAHPDSWKITTAGKPWGFNTGTESTDSQHIFHVTR